MTEKTKKQFKSGMVAIVGRPNVGKSTLLNAIVGEKITIVSKIPQTTRNQIRGIYHDENVQIVFIDTPGLHLGRDKFDKYMNKASTSLMDEVDCIIHLVDVTRRVGEEERAVVDKLRNLKCPIILGLNKVDVKKVDFAPYIELWEEVKGRPIVEIKNLTMLALSGLKGNNLDKLIELLMDHLPEGPALYPQDVVTDFPRRMAMADIVREKLLHAMKEELPHSLSVVIEDVQPRKKKTLAIKVLILVERDTQKEIVIGRKGEVLKKVGTSARIELEDLLESKVYLELFVKTQKNWRNDPSLLQDLGYIT